MTKEDFIKEVTNIGYVWADHTYDGKPGYAIKKNDTKLHVTYDAIDKSAWEQLKPGIPNVTHVTRIVGYLSRIENWNKSKLGELKNRHEGSYGVS